MAATTTLLGLVTPSQGSLSGTWGDTVNYGITDYIDIAIAGTLSFAGDGAITLANTTGSASGNAITTTTAQYMVIRITGTQTVTKVITGPSYSKLYMVDHAGATSAVTFKAAGQTGVSVSVGEKCFVYYNGTDYVKVSGVGATVSSVNASGGSTGMTFSGGPITTAGTLTMAGTLNVSNGGTGTTTITGIVKGNGAGAMTAAVAGTDYAAPTPANTYILAGNGAGGFSNVPAPVNGLVLGYNGTNYIWVAAPAAVSAANIAGGIAGQIVYQSGSSVTAFSPVGNTGQTFVSGATGQPTWVDPTSGTFGLDLTNLNGGTASTSVWNPVFFNCGGAT